MSSDELMKNTVSKIQDKLVASTDRLNKESASMDVVTTICNNMVRHLSLAVEGAKSRDTVEESYNTLLANIQVILNAVLEEPKKLQDQLSRMQMKIEAYNEILTDIEKESQRLDAQQKKQEELKRKDEAGELNKPRKPGQRPESLKAIRDARKAHEDNITQASTLSGLDTFSTSGSD